MLTTTFPAMGCHVQILLETKQTVAALVLQQTSAWFAAWETQLSRFQTHSELNQLNRAGKGYVSETLWQVLQAALHAAEYSQGLVQPTLLNALIAAGYDRNFADLSPTIAHRPALALSKTDWRAITCDATRHYVDLGGTQLDLGGIAKGWCAETVAQRLAQYGAVLVNIGGDIASRACPKGQQGWRIEVCSPIATIPSAHCWLTAGQAIATSGRDYRCWTQQGKPQHHIIDPRTQQPAQSNIISATLIAPNAQEAETAAKMLLILGHTDGLNWLHQHPHLHACWFTHEGKHHHTPHFPWIPTP